MIHGAELDLDNLPAALRTPAVQRAMEALAMMSQNDLERERYQARLKEQRDRVSYIKDAREQGLQEGRAEGEMVGRIHVYQQLLKQPLTPRDELLALPLAELQARAEALERQLGAAGP